MRDQCAKYWLRQDRISLLALVCIGLVSVYLLPGCGGGGGGSGGSSIPSELTTTITGTVYAPDGVTRVAGAIVYVPDPSRASRAAGDSAPPEPAITWTVSGSNGNFVLTDVPAGTVTIKMVTEQFSHAVEVS
ncbi:MAG TPA: hypothetical protein PLP86_09205, partial [Armatimonadota bacterium]|nr:hypothetical protein [Armatimonadota bacterium]